MTFRLQISKVYPPDKDFDFYILRSDRRYDKCYDARQPTSDLRWPRADGTIRVLRGKGNDRHEPAPAIKSSIASDGPAKPIARTRESPTAVPCVESHAGSTTHRSAVSKPSQLTGWSWMA